MLAQEINRPNSKIEITLRNNVKQNFISKFFANGEEKTTITFDSESKSILIQMSKNNDPVLIPFKDIQKLVIHQHKKNEQSDFRVALILKTAPKYLALYAFGNPHFGKTLFEELETKIFGTKEPTKVYTDAALQQAFNL
ncbi:MAG: hypothetical protein EOO98_06490 [Pedobacter sp.]|nr:MAG: hypothetical protein EOO98_06490 [Pedobacter sp.]